MSDSASLKKRKMSPAQDSEAAPLAPVGQLLVKRLSDKAKLPVKGSALAAGYDLSRHAPIQSLCV